VPERKPGFFGLLLTQKGAIFPCEEKNQAKIFGFQ
jgi:hypothetical protein